MSLSLYKQGSHITTTRGNFYTSCAGSGIPTVIFDSGLSNDADVWYAVAPAIAQVTSICLYDRANLGKSAPQPTPRSSQAIVDDLDALLATLRLPTPYILVGHSFGGWNIRLYTAQYPRNVFALVLVDTPHEAMDDRYAQILSASTWQSYLHQWNSEQIDLATSANQVASTPIMIPVRATIISAAKHTYPREWPEARLEATRLDLQAQLVAQMPGSHPIRAAQSGHMIQIDEPEIIIAAITNLIDDYRASTESGGAMPLPSSTPV